MYSYLLHVSWYIIKVKIYIIILYEATYIYGEHYVINIYTMVILLDCICFSQFFSSLGASETYTCPKCGRTYDKRPSFAKHYKFCGVDFECEFCGKKYSRSDSVKKHQRLAHSLNT